MEMHELQEFPSASMSGSAPSNEPELISSTSTSSTSSQTDSSTTSGAELSPAYSPSPTPPPSPPPPPLQPQSDPHHIISIPSLPAIPLTTRPTPSPYITKEEALKSISESIPHTMWLEKLQKLERDLQKEASKRKKEARRQSKDIYVIVSMYALLQGAIFTAVAASTIFTYEDWWGPASIVGAVTVATAFCTLDKLCYMGKCRQDAKRSEARRDAVYSKIMLMYCKGSSCEIESLDPQVFNIYERGSMCGVFSVRGVLVLGFLLGFSTLMMVSCRNMLKNSAGINS